MELICSSCNTLISPENVNISTNLAKCENCNSIHKASDLAGKKSGYIISNPPIGSKMILKIGHDETIEIHSPKKGFSFSILPLLFFTIFWLGFISFWTWSASQGSIIFALFSIPFWFVGLGMLLGIINSISESQTVRLSSNTLTLQKYRPLRSKNYEFNVEDIQSIKMKVLKPNSFSTFSNVKMLMKTQKSKGDVGIEMPTIISGVNTVYFFEDAKDAEQEWATTTLDNIITRMNQ